MPSKPDLKDEIFGGIQALFINPCFNNKQKCVCRMLEKEQNNWIINWKHKTKIFFLSTTNILIAYSS